jgi:hypothetical protein
MRLFACKNYEMTSTFGLCLLCGIDYAGPDAVAVSGATLVRSSVLATSLAEGVVGRFKFLALAHSRQRRSD